MSKVLIVSGHPDLDDSISNQAAIEEYKKALPDVVIDRLDVLYPDFKIDVPAEQAKLKEADIIVFQYPLFWYSLPALMEKWMEDVFTDGFAYGEGGTALKGKSLLLAMTIGMPENTYGTDVPVTVHDLTIPCRGTCAFCGMHYAGAEHISDVSNIPGLSEEQKEKYRKEARKMAHRIIKRIEKLEKKED